MGDDRPGAGTGARPSGVRRALRRLAPHVPSAARTPLLDLARRWDLVDTYKVSVVVAAYNSDPERLELLMASLSEQSLPAEDIEIVFVDDGSTDGTRALLDDFARRRPHVVVRTIPNSGWPSRPRNLGIEIARGHYLLFMDHDDVLFPRALERAYAYGRRHEADVVNAKEVRSTGWSWGWSAFDGDVPQSDRLDPHPLQPMTPHKLYRRRFLLQQGVRFPEGRRVLWEDIYFNVQAHARGARVAILSQHPFYHWVTTGANTSTSFRRGPDEFWVNLATVLGFIQHELRDRPGRRELVAHHVSKRVLAAVGPRSLQRDESALDVEHRHVRELVAQHAPPDLDELLLSVDRCRVELVRAGRPDLLRRLAEHDEGVTALPVLESLRWEGPELVLVVSTTLVDGEGSPVRLRRVGDRWVRDLPEEVLAVLSPQAVDVTADLERARFTVSVRGRSSRTTWPLHLGVPVTCTPAGDGTATLTATATARFDAVAFAAAHDLQDQVWDFAARFEALGHGAHRGVRGGGLSGALLGAVPAVAYGNRSGLLSLELPAPVHRLVRSVSPADVAGAATVGAQRDDETGEVALDVVLPLPGVPCGGAGTLKGRALLGSARGPATLVARDGEASLHLQVQVPAGQHRLRTRFSGQAGPTDLLVDVADDGTARVLPRPTEP